MIGEEHVRKSTSPSAFHLLFCVLAVTMTAVSAFYLLSRRHLNAYDDLYSPKFEGSYTSRCPVTPSSVIVVNHNVRYGGEVEEAIEVFQTLEPLQGADVILLQEMNETGVESMARALSCNYLYYPASASPLSNTFSSGASSR